MQYKVIKQGHSTKEVENENLFNLTGQKMQIWEIGYRDPVHRP